MSQYFDQIQTSNINTQSFLAKYLKNIRLVTLLIISIILAGVFSYTNLPRRLNPEVNIPFVIVNTILPGASPTEIESLVTIPLEDALSGVDNTTSVTSTSSENVSTIAVEFLSTVDPDKAVNDVQTAVDTVTSLPDDANNPRVSRVNIENQPVLILALTSDSDPASLRNISINLKDTLESNNLISRVETRGSPDQEVVILIKPDQAEKYNVGSLSLNTAIRSGLASFPAGSITTGNNDFSLAIDPVINNLEDIRSLPIRVGGQTVSLSDVATVQLSPESQIHTAFLMTNESDSPQKTISLSIFKTDAANITDAVVKAREIATEVIAPYPHINLTTIDDNAQSITQQFTDLIRSFAGTISLVFLTLFLFLGIRQALIVSIAIPLTFLISLTGMQLTGLSINFLSLFSLLLSLGLVVDTAIVIISAMTSYYRIGKFTPLQTGVLIWNDFITPIWSTTLTTVWAFVPLLLATGIIGEFIKTIPIVVTTTILASTTVALLITMPLMIVLLKPRIPARVFVLFRVIASLVTLIALWFLIPSSPFKPLSIISIVFLIVLVYLLRKELKVIITKIFMGNYSLDNITPKMSRVFSKGLINTQKLSNYYHRLLAYLIDTPKRRKYAIGSVVAAAIFSYLLVPAGLVTNEFFPKSDFDTIYVISSFSPGTDSRIVSQDIDRLMPQLADNPNISAVLAEIGRGNPLSDSPSNNASTRFTLSLPPLNNRDQTSIDIAQSIRDKLADYPYSDVSVVEVTGGPPVGADLSISILGPQLDEIDSYADSVVEYLNSQPGVINASKSIIPGIGKIVFRPNLPVLAQKGIGLDQIGLALRTYASGFSNSDITLNDKSYDITVKLNQHDASPDGLNTLSVQSQQGSVPISSLGVFELLPNPTAITRQDGQRTITVTANTTPDITTTSANQQLENFADTDLNLAPGYSWQTGGVNEENQRSVQSIIQAMALAALLILTTMVVLLGSFRQAFIILLSIPLAISGVFIIFALTTTPLSFPALIGVLALFGIVVNNAILLVDKINQNLQAGIKLKPAVVDAGTSRLEPIMFSSLTTMIGLIPITISDPLWRGLGGAIISGLSISGMIMLIFIPTVYYSIFKNEVE